MSTKRDRYQDKSYTEGRDKAEAAIAAADLAEADTEEDAGKLIDELRNWNQALAIATAVRADARFLGIGDDEDTAGGFDFAAAERAIAALEDRLRIALEGEPAGREQHLEYNIDAGTFTICDGPRPASS